MSVKNINFWFVLSNVCLCVVLSETKSISRKTPLNLPKVFKIQKVVEIEDFGVTKSKCESLPSTVLADVLGAAFNSRYMSIESPKYFEEEIENHHPNKRYSEFLQPFYVEDSFAVDISNKPAWEVRHGSGSTSDSNNFKKFMTNMGSDRSKRDVSRESNTMRNDRPWECGAKIKWIDLGSDYFPRFLRSVECTKKKCWYNHYVCKPRSFTLKLLRRRNGECVHANEIHRITSDELRGDFKELWVWEERAVNFCCDCVVS